MDLKINKSLKLKFLDWSGWEFPLSFIKRGSGKGNALKEFCRLNYDLIVLYNTRQIPVMRHIQKSMESQTITVHHLARYKKII